MLEELKPTTFAKHLNSEFQVQDPAAQPFALKLIQVVEGTKTAQFEAFSLLFHGPAAHFIPQGIHTINHTQLGEVDLFLVPVGKNDNGFEYEAIFNRLIEAKK